MNWNKHMSVIQTSSSSVPNSITVKPVLSDHVWAKKKWSLNGGGLFIEVEMYGIVTFGTGHSGL
jgi:hypothetical protein